MLTGSKRKYMTLLETFFNTSGRQLLLYTTLSKSKYTRCKNIWNNNNSWSVIMNVILGLHFICRVGSSTSVLIRETDPGRWNVPSQILGTCWRVFTIIMWIYIKDVYKNREWTIDQSTYRRIYFWSIWWKIFWSISLLRNKTVKYIEIKYVIFDPSGSKAVNHFSVLRDGTSFQMRILLYTF